MTSKTVIDPLLPVQPTERGVGPTIMVDRVTFDLGKIKPNSANKAVFHVSNAGNDRLEITDVLKCCGALVELDKKELSPSESTVLTAEYHVGPMASKLNKKIGIVSNDRENPKLQLTITGEVIQTLAWTPIRFTLVSYEHNATCPEITIRSLDGTPFSIRGFVATEHCLTAEYDPIHKATEFTLKPHVDAGRLNTLATTRGNVRIDVEHPNYKTVNLSFDITKALQASPAQLIMFNARAGESVLRPIQVRDNQADPNTGSAIQIDSVAFKNGSRVELRKVAASKTGCELDVEICPPGGREDECFSVDQLVIKLKDGRELTVPVRVFYQVPAVSSTAHADSNL